MKMKSRVMIHCKTGNCCWAPFSLIFRTTLWGRSLTPTAQKKKLRVREATQPVSGSFSPEG